MANAIYPSFKSAMWQGTYNLSSATVPTDLIDTGTYTYDTAHNFYDDVTGSVSTSAGLASKTFTNGTFDAADITHSAVTGNSVEAIIIWVDTAGASSTDPLVIYIDTSITGAPVTPNGGDIVIQWNGSGICAL